MASFGQALLAGVAPLVAIHALTRNAAARGSRGRLRSAAAVALALPPLAFTVPTLLALPAASWAACAALAGAVAAAVRWRSGSALAATLAAAALAALHGWAHTWALSAFSPGCAAVWAQPGATRLDRDARIERSLFSGMQRGEIGVDVDAREDFAYASYAHGGHPQGMAKLPLRAGAGAIELADAGSGGLLYPRVAPDGERVFAADHTDGQLHVLGGAPFGVLARLALGAEEPMGVAFDAGARRVLVVDRTERRDAATPEERAAGLLALSLDDPARRLGRIALPFLAGASEIVEVPGERRVVVVSDAFPAVSVVDLASDTSIAAMTYLPGVGGAAVDPVKREVFLTHPVGLVQVRALDDLHYRRTLVAHGARAVAVDASRGALYVGDGLGGRVHRIDAASGAVLGERRVGVRMRQLRVLGDGRLLTASACGVVVLDPP